MKRKLTMWAAVVFCAGGLLFAGSVALAAVIDGTAGDDTLNGTNQRDSIFGYGGNDTIYGRGAADELWGGSDSDEMYGQGNNDTLHGEGGNDALYGGPGDDELRGGDGVDVLTGQAGDDHLYDRDGNAAERDRFNCGTGIDTVQADPTDSIAPSCENVNLTGGEDLLPDLSMARIVDLQVKSCTDTSGDCAYAGQRQLRFATRIVNVGAGAFEAKGSNRDASGVMRTVEQHIYDDQGTFRSVATKVGTDGSSAQMYYAGDGHNHWHFKNLEHYTLSSSSTPTLTGAKGGFCFFDNVKWFKKDASGNPITAGVPSSPVYTNCAKNQPNATSLTVGLSRGWGDRYGSTTVDQYIDITNLPDGSYSLTATADEPDWLYEADEANNATWANLDIKGTQVSVTSYGGSNPPRV